MLACLGSYAGCAKTVNARFCCRLQTALGVQLTNEQRDLQHLLQPLHDNKHLQFLQLYAAASERLQSWLKRPLERLFGSAGGFKLQAAAYSELQRITTGELDKHLLISHLLFYGATAPSAAYLPLFTGSKVNACTQPTLLLPGRIVCTRLGPSFQVLGCGLGVVRPGCLLRTHPCRVVVSGGGGGGCF